MLINTRLLILYEVWNNLEYLRTEYIILETQTHKVTTPVTLPFTFRFHQPDDIFPCDETAVILVGN